MQPCLECAAHARIFFNKQHPTPLAPRWQQKAPRKQLAALARGFSVGTAGIAGIPSQPDSCAGPVWYQEWFTGGPGGLLRTPPEAVPKTSRMPCPHARRTAKSPPISIGPVQYPLALQPAHWGWPMHTPLGRCNAQKALCPRRCNLVQIRPYALASMMVSE